MTEAMQSFLQKLAEDTDLQNDLMACKAPEEAFKVASGAVEGLDFQEFVDVMGKINDLASKSQGELTDDDLAQVAGGWEFDTLETIMITTAVVAGGMAATAAV